MAGQGGKNSFCLLEHCLVLHEEAQLSLAYIKGVYGHSLLGLQYSTLTSSVTNYLHC